MGFLSLFITGARGYVGRRLLELIDPGRFERIETLRGDLLDPASYQEALSGCDTVIHLAAVTGKSHPAQYFRVNRDGTRALVEACRREGVRNFLHVSTIAVTYPDLTRYYYAQSKREAEEIVRASGLRYTILRPTMIFGPGAPVLTNLTKLALAPVVPVFGDGRARVQPVYVDDLVRLILSLVQEGEFTGRTIEAGGPDVLTIEELLQRIRRARGGEAGRAVHLPMRLIEPLVAATEGFLPITAGQLKALTNSGSASGPPVGTTGLDTSLRLSFAGEARRQLAKECTTYTKYLTGLEPTQYILSKYEEFHEIADPDLGAAFDRLLVSAAARSPWMVRLADAYASRFCRASALRRKLVLLLGLLESAQPSAVRLDAPTARSAPGAWAALAAAAVRYAAALAAAVFLLAPLHVALGARRPR